VVYTPLRHLADVDDVVRAVLQAGGVTVGANIPADLATRIGPADSHYVSARRFGGAAVHARLLDRAAVSVDAWANTRRGAADVAETCRVLLFTAWRAQTVHAGASISSYSETSAPAELRTGGQPPDEWRFNAAYSLHVRPRI